MSTISNDPASIPEKAKTDFSWREFGYIACSQYMRINARSRDDGLGVVGDMITDYRMDIRIMEMFRAGWEAYLHKMGQFPYVKESGTWERHREE